MPKPGIDKLLDAIPETLDMLKNPRTHKVNKVEFEHNGYDCLAVRTEMGHWVGYVIVPETHPLYNKDMYDLDVEVHGGLTFGDKLHWEGRLNGKFAFGFDYAHAYDTGGTEDEVQSECRHLVDFLKQNEEVN